MKRDLNLRSDARKRDFDFALEGCGFNRTASDELGFWVAQCFSAANENRLRFGGFSR